MLNRIDRSLPTAFAMRYVFVLSACVRGIYGMVLCLEYGCLCGWVTGTGTNGPAFGFGTPLVVKSSAGPQKRSRVQDVVVVPRKMASWTHDEHAGVLLLL